MLCVIFWKRNLRKLESKFKIVYCSIYFFFIGQILVFLCLKEVKWKFIGKCRRFIATWLKLLKTSACKFCFFSDWCRRSVAETLLSVDNIYIFWLKTAINRVLNTYLYLFRNINSGDHQYLFQNRPNCNIPPKGNC